jgi:hypothetical protein|uniref:Uncharacterized protein n=1 Tax=viral metagenome TaxID=1070528 RepID=A0A6C0LUY8_9ZZZZ
MKRNVPNRTLLSKDTFTEHNEPTRDFCPIKQKKKKIDDVERLVDRYNVLNAELQSIRGQLYRWGVNPEK